MNRQSFLEGITGLVSLHGVAAVKGRELGLSTHQLRVLLSVHYLSQTKTKVTRSMVSKYTYLWLSSVSTTVAKFVEMGFIKPIEKPRYHLHLTETGLAVLAELERGYRNQKRLLECGPPVLNRPVK